MSEGMCWAIGVFGTMIVIVVCLTVGVQMSNAKILKAIEAGAHPISAVCAIASSRPRELCNAASIALVEGG